MTLTLEQAWFSCPESGEREPYALTFIPAFAPEGLDERTMAQSARGKSSFTFEITTNVLRALFPVDQALTVLNEITKRFGTKESRFVLDMAKLTPNALRAAAAGGKVKTQVAVIPDSGPQLLVGDENFDPTLRQKVAIRTASGSIVGAELRIRVDE